jgi:hypothetical protein
MSLAALLHSGCGACQKKGLGIPFLAAGSVSQAGLAHSDQQRVTPQHAVKILRSCAFSGLVVLALAPRLGYLALVWTGSLGNAHSEAYKTLAISLTMMLSSAAPNQSWRSKQTPRE